MTAFNTAAKAELRDCLITQAAWRREWFTDGKWHGDACGCPDDRCIGYHHDSPDDCGCLRVLISLYQSRQFGIRVHADRSGTSMYFGRKVPWRGAS